MDFYTVLSERGIVSVNGVRIPVTLLVARCPYRYIMVVEETPEMIEGRIQHAVIESLLRERGWETEVKLELTLQDPPATIVGKIDAVNHDNHLIVEIKSGKRLYGEYVMQLEIYRWMWYRLHGQVYDGEIWFVRNGRIEYRIRPWLRDPQAMEPIVVSRLRQLLDQLNTPESLCVRNEYCFLCPLYRRCPATRRG